ncbi:MAG: dihydropteroate synthase [Proteobacteria bacterium]|nr:dihydropteroate synthase [Pseudomonadota bacterium]
MKSQENLMPIKIMGVLNVTPDSFFDGGRYFSPTQAIQRALRLAEEGADIIDIGGESTRPGAKSISETEECDRVLPVIEALVKEITLPISIDTRHVSVMKAAVQAGVKIINDVSALSSPEAMDLVSRSSVIVCLMHMQGLPETMQILPTYENVVTHVYDFLKNRLELCQKAGILRENIWIDPGFGFGKNLAHNLSLLGNLSVFKQLGSPIVVGLSRKSMFGEILNKPADQRLFASIAGAVIAALQGSTIIRTHDVAPTKDALAVVKALRPFIKERLTDVCTA